MNGAPSWNRRVRQRRDTTWQPGEREGIAKALSVFIASTIDVYHAVEPPPVGKDGWRYH